MRIETETYLNNVISVIERMQDCWPMTLRQVYYQLVQAGDIENTRNQYQKLSRVLTKARLKDQVSWEAIEDRSREKLDSDGWGSFEYFKKHEMSIFLEGYRRDLLQGQNARMELWIEKDALSRILHKVAYRYCVPVIVAKGYASTSFKNECRKRVLRNAEFGQGTIILYFGDLDPSGMNMLPTMMKTLHEDFGLREWVESRRIALNRDQVDEYSLPINPDAVKPKDTRTPKYREQYGDVAVELDALHPETLRELVRESIDSVLDLSQFHEQKRIEEEEVHALRSLKGSAREMIGGTL